MGAGMEGRRDSKGTGDGKGEERGDGTFPLRPYSTDPDYDPEFSERIG